MSECMYACTLSRHRPLTIAVGKRAATQRTASLICVFTNIVGVRATGILISLFCLFLFLLLELGSRACSAFLSILVD